MRIRSPRRVAVAVAALALTVTACGDDGGDAPDPDGPAEGEAATDDVEVDGDGPTVTVSSFNFPESVILAEIYGQTLEDVGFPVDRQLDLGARELIYPQLQDGELSLLPEYLGSALVTGLGEDAPQDVEEGLQSLRDAFADDGIEVLEPAPAENANVFVTTAEFADDNDLTTVADLAELDGVTFAGPPECEERDTCYAGLVEVYGLDDVAFSSVQEPSARLGALTGGEVELALFFSTDAVLADDSLRVLDDPESIVPPENIVPVLDGAVVDAYGDDLIDLLDEISQALTTDALIELNSRAAEGVAPEEIARGWLEDNGFVG